jgi:hypothetical protein
MWRPMKIARRGTRQAARATIAAMSVLAATMGFAPSALAACPPGTGVAACTMPGAPAGSPCCRKCAAGYFSDTGQSCKPCGYATVSNATNTACVQCRRGTVANSNHSQCVQYVGPPIIFNPGLLKPTPGFGPQGPAPAGRSGGGPLR